MRLPAVDPVKPETDKLQRALGISPWVQDGRVLFGPGQTALTRALLAVPQDAHAWDLVDAFGLAVTGLPPVPPARSRLVSAGDDPGKLARSYAVKPRGEPEKAPLPPGADADVTDALRRDLAQRPALGAGARAELPEAGRELHGGAEVTNAERLSRAIWERGRLDQRGRGRP